MRRKTRWLAVGLVVAMCLTATMSAVSLAEEPAEAAEEVAETEVPETEAAETEEPETEAAETEAPEEEETETEEESETEESEAELISVPYEEEDAWDQVAITNSDYVDTALFIHEEADDESEVLGYLYKGAAVWILDKGDVWASCYSNGITGYIMSDLLLYGEDVEEIAYYYGVEGVQAEWDGVVVFASEEADTELDVMNTGDVFQVINDGSHMIEIQYDEDTTAYVSEDDVTPVILFEPATPKDGERVQLTSLKEEEIEYESDDYWEEEPEDYEDYEDYDYDYAYEDSYAETYVEPVYSYTEPTYDYSYSTTTSTTTTSSSSTSTTTQTEAVEDGTTISSGNAGGAYYDAETGIFYDDDGNVVSTYSYSYEESYDVDTYSYYDDYSYDDSYYYEEETSTSTSASAGDTDLLAALIYCEAGNQSYEGMVAVGAVVMNRVYSSSFPNTISEVIYQSGQFTPASSGALASALASGVGSTYYSAAADALAGSDPTGGALYFNTSHGSGVQIGDHWFY